jgi:hypothetical protein
MSKKLLVRGFVLALCLALALSAVASGASTTKNLSTNFTLVNLGSATANVTVDYIKEDGSPWTGSSYTALTLAPNGGQAIVAQYFDTLTSGKGSVVLSSNQPLGAVVQILARGQTPTSGAYSGFTSGSAKVYAPLVQRRLFGASGVSNSQIMVQNTTTDSELVTIYFYGAGASIPATFSKTQTIAAGATFYYDIDDEAGLNPGWYGSVEVDAGSGEVAVVVNNFAGDNGMQTYNAFPISSVGTGWAIPLFASRLAGAGGNLNTPVAVQNLSGGIIPVDGITMTCKAAMGSDFSIKNTAAVADKGSYYFNPVTNFTIPGNWYGSCVVSTTGPNVVVFVQMRKPSVSDETAAFEAFNTSATDTKVFVPLAAKRLTNGTATAITFQNLSASAAVVRLTYTRSTLCLVGDPSYVFSNVNIPANGQLIQNLRLAGTQPTIPAGWYGTLVVEDDPVEATPARPIVGFIQITNFLGAPGDTLLAHDAFTQP